MRRTGAVLQKKRSELSETIRNKTARAARYGEIERLTKPLPDEVALSHLGRIRLLNGFPSGKPLHRAVRQYAIRHFQLAPDITLLDALAYISGCNPRRYAACHSFLPFSKVVARHGRVLLPHGDTAQRSLKKRDGMATPLPYARYCEQCVADDLRSYVVTAEEKAAATNAVWSQNKVPTGVAVRRALGRRPRGPLTPIRRRTELMADDEIEAFFMAIDQDVGGCADKIQRARRLRDKVIFIFLYAGECSIDSVARLPLEPYKEAASKWTDTEDRDWSIGQTPQRLPAWVRWYIDGPRRALLQGKGDPGTLFITGFGRRISTNGAKARFAAYLRQAELHRRGITPRHLRKHD